jgi:hypothetical protein
LLRRERRLVAVDPPDVTLPGVVTCVHDLHVNFGGRRVGLLVHPSGNAAMLDPCPHVNKDGL